MSKAAPKVAGVPTYDQMFWPALLALKELGGSGTNQEIEEKVIAIAHYTEEQQSHLHKDGPKTLIAYRLGWTRSYLRIAGAIENSGRGIWSITEYGKGLTKEAVKDIVGIVRAKLADLPGADTDGSDTTALVDHTETWTETLLDVLQHMSPKGFEHLCQRLLRESGFTSVTVTGRSGDGGIDGVGILRVSLLNFQVFFQCKRYSGSVGSGQVRDFRGAMIGRADKGLLITTGVFTTEAKKEAARHGAPPVDLIDGDMLCSLLKDLKLGVQTEMVEKVHVDPDWFKQFNEK